MNTSKRNYSIDLYRNFSMLTVVILHVLGYSGLLNNNGGGLWYWLPNLLYICALGAVNSFSMTSGYLMYDRPFKYSRVINLWVTVLFYSVGITGLFLIFDRSVVGVKNIIFSLFPVTFSQYWYFTAYFAMYFFLPFINKHLMNSSKRQDIVLMSTCILLFSFSSLLKGDDVFSVSLGYSPLWLTVMYMLGAMIKKYNILEKIKTRYAVLAYILCVLLCMGSMVIINFIFSRFNLGLEGDYSKILLQYTAPTVIIIALSLFVIFSKIKVSPKGFLARILPTVSALSFSVYLIHMHPMIKFNVLTLIKKFIFDVPVLTVIPIVIALSLAIFAVCIGIDYLRSLLFKVLKIDTLGTKAERLGTKIIDKLAKEQKQS